MMNMESVLSKLRDRVSTTVYHVTSNITTALPGNALTREYDLLRHVSSGGTRLAWKIYDAVKKSTRQEAALFVYDKKQLERYPKKDREMVLEVLRRGVSQLTRLRHPSMLTVQHGIEESRDSLAFATEPVIGSLANLLGDRENMPSPVPPELDNYEFYDVEIKYGLLQISEGLTFLHNDCKMLHRNIAPESIIINRNGVWKIGGFDFSVMPINANETPLKFPSLNLLNYNDTPLIALPNYDYIAPEYLDRSVTTIETSADMYSLGALTYALYNKGKPLLPTEGTISSKRIDQIKKLPNSTFSCIPEDSRDHIKMLLNLDTAIRPDSYQFSKLHIFEDVLVKTLQYLDALYQWDNLQKSHFYKGLPEVLSRMPKRVKLRRVVSCLVNEFVNTDMVPFVLPNILMIAEESTDEEFQTWIFPDLITIFKMQEPIQIGIILMQRMDLLVSKCKSYPDSLREHILPLIYRSLESDAQQIQELCLSVIPSLAHLVDYPSMKNSLLPKIKKLLLNAKLLSVRVNCLICLGKILDHLDKWLVIDEVLPVLPEVPSREPAVIMAIIGIYKIAMSNNKLGITKDVIASKVIPFLVPLTIENGLSLQQFQSIMTLIREMLNKVEEEQQIKLEQMNSIKTQQNSLFTNTRISPSHSLDNFPNMSTNMRSSGSNNSLNANKSNTLSLEEKERIVRERELNERLKSQPPMIPNQAKPHDIPKPKDLTSTLINSNLTNLSLVTPQFSNVPQQMQPNYGPLSMTNQISSQTFNQFQTYPNQIPFNSFQSYQSPSPAQPQQFNQINMSAFDNLTDLKKPMKLPMNGASTMNPMTNSNTTNWTPLMSANTFVNRGPNIGSLTTQKAKPLSKSEVEDLLG